MSRRWWGAIPLLLVFCSRVHGDGDLGPLFETGRPSMESFSAWAIGYGAVTPDHDHVAAYVSASDSQRIRIGARAEITIASSNDETDSISGSVTELLPEADLRTGQAIVTIQIPKQAVPSRTYANVKIEISSRRSLAVLTSAVIWMEGKPYVFKQNAKKEFDPTLIEIGQETPAYTEIRRGLGSTDVILIEGALEWAYKDQAAAEAE